MKKKYRIRKGSIADIVSKCAGSVVFGLCMIALAMVG